MLPDYLGVWLVLPISSSYLCHSVFYSFLLWKKHGFHNTNFILSEWLNVWGVIEIINRKNQRSAVYLYWWTPSKVPRQIDVYFYSQGILRKWCHIHFDCHFMWIISGQARESYSLTNHSLIWGFCQKTGENENIGYLKEGILTSLWIMLELSV